MSDSFFSPEWPSIAKLKPKLRPHLRVHRQTFRGRVWYIIENEISSRHHRIDNLAYELVSRLNGELTVNQIWEQMVESCDQDTPDQNNIIQLIGSLHQSDLIQTGITPDGEELFERNEQQRKAKNKALVNPFSFKARLINPTKLLNILLPINKILFNWFSGVILFVLFLVAGWLAHQHWNEIVIHASQRLPSEKFWLLVWLIYPIIKFCHELGHALAIRHWGGRVQEMGISLLMLFPVPYVNASSATLFPEKHARMIVSAAGILVEVFFASVALLVWLNISDGLIRDIAFVVMSISGISTILFNANPLIKFDGYHFLADWLEIPNLAKRSAKHWEWLSKRYLLRVTEATPVKDLTPGESKWLFSYAPASWAYRWLILIIITSWMLDVSRGLAIATAAYFLYSLLVKPGWKIARYLWQSNELSTKRIQAIIITGNILLFGFLIITVIPMPFATVTQAVVWTPDESKVRSDSNGFVNEIMVNQGEFVKKGQVLVQLQNNLLQTKIEKLKAQITATKIKLQDSRRDNPGKARQIERELESTRKELALSTSQVESLSIRSQANGRIIIPKLDDFAGRYITQGSTLGYILGDSEVRLKAAVQQRDSERLSQYPGEITVQIAQNKTKKAELIRTAPKGSNQLPSPALGTMAGGIFLTDPSDKEGLTTLDPVFLMDLSIPKFPTQQIGQRIWVRFDHGKKPLIKQWAILWEQLFLQHFSSKS